MLVQLLYMSRYDTVISDITNHMAEVRIRNKVRQLSSILLTVDNYYIHLIEGERTNVNTLYESLMNDYRHHNLTLLRYVEVKAREFADLYGIGVDISAFNIGDTNILFPDGVPPISEITSSRAATVMRRIHAHLIVKDLHKL